MSFKNEVQTPKGRGFLGHDGAPVVTVTDLGYVMLKVWYPETDSYVNYRLSDIKEILPSDITIINDSAYEYAEQSETADITLG